MSVERDPLERALKSVCDGSPLDWDAALASAAPADRPRLAALREISRIGAFSRELQHMAEPGPAPARWGDLLLFERIGRGSRSEVFRAWDPRLQRDVALKLLHPGAHGAGLATDESPLLEEGRALARLAHPHIAAVHGIDRHDDRVGLSMELVRGRPLDRELERRGPYDAAEAARLGREIGSALAAVHAAGLLHRDVKPANVVRDERGRHVLTDFGLGLPRDRAASLAAWPSGTPLYMAPELLAGAPPSARTDIYSLGLLLWFALTGRQPYAVRDLAELRSAAAQGPAPRLGALRSDLPSGLVALVERLIAPDPEARPASLAPVLEALAAGSAGNDGASARAAPRPSGRARRPLLLSGAAIALLLMVALLAWRPDRPVQERAPAYAVEATFLRRGAGHVGRLVPGDRVVPGDRLSLSLRASRPLWVYVLNEDERGEMFLLFPQPLFDLRNPLPADSSLVLPGPIGGRENAWLVTSAGGREHFLVVASLEPVPEFEADLARLPAPAAGRAVNYAAVGDDAVARLRGLGGIAELPPGAPATPAAPLFARFRDLVDADTPERDIWIRHFHLENPR